MDGGPGRLPRTTFVDDPFFHQDPFDGFPRDGFPRDGGFSRSPQPQRRFGSTPRLIDDEFFDEFEHNMPSAFGSLPRHRHTSRSPQPPTYRGSPSGPQQYQPQQQSGPQYQQQQQPQERSIPVQRASPNSSTTSSSSSQQQQPQATPPSKKSPVPKAAVEINNATSSYTNGELNPDRKQQQPASDSPNANVSTSNSVEPEIQVKNVKIEQATPPQKQQQQQAEKAVSEDQKPSEKMDTSNGAPTATGGAAEARRTLFNDKKTSIDTGCSEKLIHLLDETERRVALLREMASQLEQEKEQLLDTLHDVKINADFLRLAQHDREDIDATSERLLKRIKAVEVSVFTPRNEDQTRALEEVNKLIEAVTEKIKDDISSAKGTIERYFNACCPDDQPGSVDLRFQAMVIECTADDQKKIRRKLAQIIEQIDRAERVCNPDY
jgi:BCL2-associated athanogene 2